MFLLASPGVCSPGNLLCVPVFFFFSFYKSIQHFLWFLHILMNFFSFCCIRFAIWDCAISINEFVEFFPLFWNVVFCLYYFALSRCLLNLLSFNLFLPLVSSDLREVVFWGSFLSVGFLYVSLSEVVSLVGAVYLFLHLASFLIQVLYLCWDSLEGYIYNHWLVLLLDRLTRLIWRWCLLGYVAVRRSLR